MSTRHPSRRDFHRTALAGLATLGTTGAGLLASPAARAAGYPERPLTFICPWPAGGTADITMRALCVAAAKPLGQTIVVENRAGASGMLGLRSMAQAAPDGYTIGQIPISVARFSQLGSLPLDPLKDLSYIARVSGQTFGIACQAGSPYKTLADVIAAAKAKPGRITYSSAGMGGATHVGMEEVAHAAGIELLHIPYKGGALALQALLAGEVDLLIDSSSWAPHVLAGKLRLLATLGERRTQDFKDTPTVKEQGLNVVVDAPNGIGAPKGVDPAVLARLRAAFKLAAASPEFTAACDKIDAPLMYLDGPDYAQYVAQTVQKEKLLIERLKLKELMAKG
ncbi:Bug family tripartite tricarboxylate transporter substrate binding protein [Ideonella livida]|uniref:Tripartite tricarboxylate transporter substrate binding protein n=1 Tax=Ideonella livida TaxID=2707176 RepID=A0A7C9TN30_9BURK|nr:tripartite tricarboxylate transporter substrate binding protein [Ideonella livida]NDY93822.1 tripartite tricarboxylate transporter substrate binding protein [Ideonella livida]